MGKVQLTKSDSARTVSMVCMALQNMLKSSEGHVEDLLTLQR